MLFNRHFFILAMSVFFIGIIFWWQNPGTTVSAMTRGEYISNPYNIVKNYWKRLDYRQLELASEMTALEATNDHAALAKLLTENPLLSIQKTLIENSPEENTFLVKITLGSSIDKQQTIDYLVRIEPIREEWLITSIKALPKSE